MPNGISVVICCHNSAARLPQTLSYLRKQATSGQTWEVIVVDNASEDNTSNVALRSWPKEAPAQLRVVYEPKLGLSNARLRGLREARHGVVAFVDDDNWVSPDWVGLVGEIMGQHPEVGACGGDVCAVTEVERPWWFEGFQGFYAVGSRPHDAGEITWTEGLPLFGAGLIVRKEAVQQILRDGFCIVNEDRTGNALSSGGDTELCFAIRAAGWRLWYDPRLKIEHFIPAQRLTWTYLRKLLRGMGTSVGNDLYFFPRYPKSSIDRWRQTWQWQSLSALRFLMKNIFKLIQSLSRPLEGDAEVLEIESKIGRLFKLLRMRRSYNSIFVESRDAAWRQL